MMKVTGRLLLRAAVAATTLAGCAPAVADTLDLLDLEAGVGASSNPFLQIPAKSSLFGRISASGTHTITSQRGSTVFRGYVENTTYLHDYGSKQIFDVSVQTNQRVSQTVTVYGSAHFSGDFAGQLSNRIIGVPSQPIPPDLNNPLPPTSFIPDVFGLSTRTFRIGGDVGASIRSGERATISLTAGAERNWFTGSFHPAAYNTFFATGSYSREVSSRTSFGASLSVQRQDLQGNNYSNVINPALTARTQLTERLEASGSVGVMIISDHRSGLHDTRATPSFSGSLCDQGTISNFCVSISRDARSSLSTSLAAAGESAVTTTLAANYFRRLSAWDTVQATVSGARYSSRAFGENLNTTYLSGIVSYDHSFGQRLSAGASAGARQVFQPGPDPRGDINANLYLRYRIGKLP